MRKTHVWKIAIAGVVFAVASMAQAAEPPWIYVEGGYLVNDPDLEGIDSSETGDNWFVGGMGGGKMWHVFVDYQQGDFVDGVDNKNWKLGVGWHGLLGERADLVADGAYLKNDEPFDDSGWQARIGVRWRIIKLVEVAGFVSYVDFSDLDSDTVGELQALLYVWRIGIGLSYEGGGDVADQYGAFLRFNFGKK
jgi:hypothetical protein